MEDYVYFIEDLTECEHLSTGDMTEEEEEEEWDAEGAFSTEVWNQDLFGDLLVFRYDSDDH